MGTPWKMPLAVMNRPTGDGRMFDPGSLEHLSMPHPFRYVPTDAGGHTSARVVGRTDKIEYGEGGQPIGTGVFFDGEDAPEATRAAAQEALYLAQQGVIGPSVDLDSSKVEARQYAAKATLGEVAACGCADGGHQPEKVAAVTSGRIRAATLVQIPAFAEMAAQGTYGADVDPDGQFASNADGFSIADFVTLHEAAEEYAAEIADLGGDAEEFARKRKRPVDDDGDQDDSMIPGQYAIDPGVGGGVDRAKLDDSDFVDPARRRFPIVTPQDVHDAVRLQGRAKPPVPNFQARLESIARRKGQAFVDALPASWSDAATAALVAAAAPRLLDRPPAAWFDDPKLDGPTPLTITDDGRVYGHIAAWGTCHTGIGHACITPPKSRTGYAYFHTGEVVTAEGRHVPVGRLTYGGGHAKHQLGYAAAAEHYDATSAVGAHVRAGEDKSGIWVAGAMAPTATASAYSTMRAAPLSGDWRRVGGNLELVAALHVNTAGFPIPRAVTAGGEVLTLTAAGALEVALPTGIPAQDAIRAMVAAVLDEREAQLEQQQRAARMELIVGAMEDHEWDRRRERYAAAQELIASLS